MFVLDGENGVRWVEDDKPFPADTVASFDSEASLLKAADARELSREDLEEIWNGFAGTPKLKPVVKFRNRPFGVKRIWWAIQRLAPQVWPTPKVKAKAARAETPVRRKKENANGFPREGSKAFDAIALMKRAKGASGPELQEKMGWLPHTVRGFISTIQSKHGIKVLSERGDEGTVYRVEA
jgi:hypothetical protein